MRIALGVEYDGAPFCGWQSQPSGLSVQDALTRAVSPIAGGEVALFAAGRTDARVHASLQVVHFDAPAARPTSAWVRGVNSFLPAAIAVQWAKPVADDFHARYSATGRHYTYLLSVAAVRPALMAHRIGWWHRPLDVNAIRVAARCLVGEHDFSAFRASDCQAKTPVKTLHHLAVDEHAGVIRFDFHANAFLHHMVRNIVGSLVYVGCAREPVLWMQSLVAGRDRTKAAPTMTAAGLYLTGVDYDPKWELLGTRRPVKWVACESAPE